MNKIPKEGDKLRKVEHGTYPDSKGVIFLMGDVFLFYYIINVKNEITSSLTRTQSENLSGNLSFLESFYSESECLARAIEEKTTKIAIDNMCKENEDDSR